MILTPEQKVFLDKVVDGSWSINPETGLVDVDGHVAIYISESRLLVSFGKVTGHFNCNNCDLVTLDGCPYWVGGNFTCTFNKLTSYKYAPNYIGGDARVWLNKRLREIDWCPDYLGGELYFSFMSIDNKYHKTIIPELEELISKGIKIYAPERYYYKYRDKYYLNLNRRIAELI